MTDKKSSSTLLNYLTPMGAVNRALSSVARAKQSLQTAAGSMGQLLPGQAASQVYEDGDVRNIQDSRLRYQAMYEMHGWTQVEIAQQLKTLRLTKMVAFVSAIVALSAVLILAVKAPLWLALVLIPMSGAGLVLGVAQGFRYALYETQIKLGDFISAREFASREDFWHMLIG